MGLKWTKIYDEKKERQPDGIKKLFPIEKKGKVDQGLPCECVHASVQAHAHT